MLNESKTFKFDRESVRRSRLAQIYTFLGLSIASSSLWVITSPQDSTFRAIQLVFLVAVIVGFLFELGFFIFMEKKGVTALSVSANYLTMVGGSSASKLHYSSIKKIDFEKKNGDIIKITLITTDGIKIPIERLENMNVFYQILKENTFKKC
jgi:hypothetical protein